MAQIKLKRLLRDLCPPLILESVRGLRRRLHPTLEYCPGGWDKNLLRDAPAGWNTDSAVEATRAENAEFYRSLQLGGPLGKADQHNLHLSFAYVLARAAHQKARLSVLDWGGGLGHYYHVAKAALPELEIEYHCEEIEALAAAGKQLVPEITWHSSDSSLARQYDIVMMSGSLQYAQDWQGMLERVTRAARDWFFLTRLPVVERVPTFTALQRIYGTSMLHWQFNRASVLGTMRTLGFDALREFDIGDRPYIKNAPEQCELRGWLFRRKSAS